MKPRTHEPNAIDRTVDQCGNAVLDGNLMGGQGTVPSDAQVAHRSSGEARNGHVHGDIIDAALRQLGPYRPLDEDRREQ